MTEKFNRLVDGPFSLLPVDITAPAAGSDFHHYLEEGYTYQLLSMTLTFTTSVVVANRIVILHSHIGQKVLMSIPVEGLQVASEALVYNFTSGGFRLDLSALLSLMFVALPTEVLLPGGTRISSQTLNIDAGDQFSNIYLYLRKWPVIED